MYRMCVKSWYELQWPVFESMTFADKIILWDNLRSLSHVCPLFEFTSLLWHTSLQALGLISLQTQFNCWVLVFYLRLVDSTPHKLTLTSRSRFSYLASSTHNPSLSNVFQWGNGWGSSHVLRPSCKVSLIGSKYQHFCLVGCIVLSRSLPLLRRTLVVRFILGMCEGAITPGFMIVTSMFYTVQNKQSVPAIGVRPHGSLKNTYSRLYCTVLMNGFAVIFLGFVAFGTTHIKTTN